MDAQRFLQLTEVRPFRWTRFPAVHHQVIDGGGCITGLFHAISVRQFTEKVLISFQPWSMKRVAMFVTNEPLSTTCTWIRSFAQWKEFPHDNSERPDVRLGGEDAIADRFNGHPLDRQRALNMESTWGWMMEFNWLIISPLPSSCNSPSDRPRGPGRNRPLWRCCRPPRERYERPDHRAAPRRFVNVNQVNWKAGENKGSLLCAWPSKTFRARSGTPSRWGLWW